ncbi:MAG: hypothetical protein ACRENE_30085 [Polyangiaceae bacterium]
MRLGFGLLAAGAPLVGCGGRVLIEDFADGAIAETVDAREAPPGEAETDTVVPTGPAQGPRDAGSNSSSSQSGFNDSSASPAIGTAPMPCMNYPAIYNECTPTTASSGCQYYDNEHMGVYPTNYSVPAGCRVDVVEPAGPSCQDNWCTCDSSGAWKPDQTNPPGLLGMCIFR